MDKKQKKNSSKNTKPAKKNAPREVEQKPVRVESKSKSNYDLPAVQCKDTLLLDYDYNKQYSKRSVVSNWDRYAELPDDDDENGQLSAPDFQQLLSASKSIGDHFTFAAERSWQQSEASNPSEEGSVASDLFKLNISNLKNGIGRLPLYVRQGFNENMFTEEEITNMDYRVNFFDKENTQKPSTANQINQNVLNVLTGGGQKVKVDVLLGKTPTEAELAKKLSETILKETPTLNKTVTAAASPSLNKIQPIKPINETPKAKSNKTEDIQDWLDDILNES